MDLSVHELSYLAQSHWQHFRFRLGEMVGRDRGRRAIPVAPVIDQAGAEITAGRVYTYDTLVGKLGVRVRTRARVAEVMRDRVRLVDGQIIPAQLVVWAAGVKAPDFLRELDGLESSRFNQLVVMPTLQTTRDANIFAIGDCAAGRTDAPRRRTCPGAIGPGHDRPVDAGSERGRRLSSASGSRTRRGTRRARDPVRVVPLPGEPCCCAEARNPNELGYGHMSGEAAASRTRQSALAACRVQRPHAPSGHAPPRPAMPAVHWHQQSQAGQHHQPGRGLGYRG